MKRTLAATAIILAALLLSGCTSSGSSDSSGPPVTDGGGVTGEPAPDKGVSGGGEIVTDNRDVVTTGTVSLTVKDPISSAQSAADITEQAGGRVDSRSENPSIDGQPSSANLVLRIPADELDNAVIELKKLGTVNKVSLNATDITQQTQDIEARITSLQTSVDRLLSLMAKATDTADLIAIESALSERQSELEGLQAQRDYLADQVDFSTISLELYSEGTVSPPNPDSFWDGLVAGWNTLVSALSGALVALGFMLPWLAALGLVGAVVLLIVWLSTRKRKAA